MREVARNPFTAVRQHVRSVVIRSTAGRQIDLSAPLDENTGDSVATVNLDGSITNSGLFGIAAFGESAFG